MIDTNGLPIGPVVSDIAAEIVAAAVDRVLTKQLDSLGVSYQAVRFKDDYRVLVKSEADAKCVIKCLQMALKGYNLELSDEKTSISELPNGLFREWVSLYHAAYPQKLQRFSWKQFRELYLAVIGIDRKVPGTGVIDRFLADIVTGKGQLKVGVNSSNLEKAISMLLMLGSLRIKAFPKIMAIIENLLDSPFGRIHRSEIVQYLEHYLHKLSAEEMRNKYLVTWISYFLVSNGLTPMLSSKPKLKDPIARSTLNNRSSIFKGCKDHSLFMGCRSVRKKISMFDHLDIFDPPKIVWP